METYEEELWNEEELGFGAEVKACQEAQGITCDECRHVNACRGDVNGTR